MFLIYTEKTSPRFTYIIKHIFSKMLGVEYRITSDLEAFILSNDAKISYGKTPIGDEFFIKNFGLLFQKGVDEVEIFIRYWDETPYFFASKTGQIPFDIFSASFYLLSRYEEYLPHLKTEHNGYPATESLAYRYKFLDLPLVDIWVRRFRKLLQQRFPNEVFQPKSFRQLSVIEVCSAYQYKHKDAMRTIAGWVRSLVSLQFHKALERFLVLCRFRRDPYDNYEEIIHFHKKNNINSIFFFLIAHYSAYDKGLSPHLQAYRELIKTTADYNVVSVLASYESHGKIAQHKAERKMMIDIINRPVKRVRMNYNRLQIPDTYQDITDAGYNEEYSMGYADYPGFRASTCSPFYFYDLSLEVQLPLRVNPFCFSSKSLENIKNKKDALKIVRSLKAQTENVSGKFITIFSHELMGSHTKYMDFYKQMVSDFPKN